MDNHVWLIDIVDMLGEDGMLAWIIGRRISCPVWNRSYTVIDVWRHSDGSLWAKDEIGANFVLQSNRWVECDLMDLLEVE